MEDVPVIGDRQPILREWGMGEVAARSLAAIARPCADADGGVQGEATMVGAELLLHRRAARRVASPARSRVRESPDSPSPS